MVLAVALAFATPVAYGQGAPKRLSDWLLEQPASADAYPLGLSWRALEEVPAQSALRFELLNALAGSDRKLTADAASRSQLHEWLQGLPVTGRVLVAVPDARWLQANPTRDPVLLSGHSAVLPQRPRTVTVVMGNGSLCHVTHAQRLEARRYLDACSPTGAASADWAWIAQPDGRVQRYGVATWNRELQDEPAPGAWIWGPPRGSGWPEGFSRKLIAFLATQGPAPDPLVKGEGSEGRGVRSEAGGASPRRTPGSRGPGASLDPAPGSSPGQAFRRRNDNQGGAAAGFRFSDLAEFDRNGAVRGEKIQPTIHDPRSTIHDPRSSERSRGLELTASDWGNVGLLQTPTARMREAGHFTFNLSRTQPYTHGNVFVQPFDWMEAGFRYSEISNQLYGPADLSGSQSYKDKSIDVKFQLWPESAYVPQIALGFRDIAGTGLFSSEYVVASKRTGDLDWSLGLGWGYLAGNSRPVDVGQGGTFDFGNYFSGRVRPFGGVQWQTPWDRWIVKLEYDGNNYQDEPRSNNQRQNSPLNFGLVYRWGRATDITLGVERGNTVTLGLTLHAQLDGLSVPKGGDPPRVPVAAARPQQPPDWTATARELKRQTDWNVRSIEQRGGEVRVVLDEADAIYWRERVDRAAAVLHRDAPATVDRFVFSYPRRGLDMAEHVVDRGTWVTQQLQPWPPSERREPIIARAPDAVEHAGVGNVVYTGSSSPLETGFGLGLAQSYGGPDAFILFQVYAEERARLRLRDDTWLQGSLRLRLVDNYDKFKYTAPSDLPRVRTFVREYLTTSALTMANLQFTHVGKAGGNQYYSVYGGYLEEMFGGAGGEWLYRPFASRVAFGVDANAVRQRDFKQDFGFRDYQTATGHATLYWDSGWKDVLARLSAGRYLAGDSGVTIDLSRQFPNGVVMGAFATKTNISAQRFGEGSFDKGVYVGIPFDAMLAQSTNSVANFLWRPLTRDGGAKLARANTLYELTRSRSDRALKVGAAPVPNDALIPSDRREARVPEAKGLEPYTRIVARPTAQQWRSDSSHEFRLIEALQRQEFRNARVAYDGSNRLTVTLASDQLHPISRAVGRAARTALRLAPDDAREIRIVFAERTDPVVAYEFFDVGRLERYFNGAIGKAELGEYVKVDYLNRAAREADPLAQLGDISSDAERPGLLALLPGTRGIGRVVEDLSDAASTATEVNWLRAGALGASVLLASSALDNRADRFAKDHAGAAWLKALTRTGDAIPWLALAGSAAAAFDGSDPVRSRTGYAATEAGMTALVVSTGLKYAVGRARPEAGLGRNQYQHSTSEDRFQSFPSRHSAIAWAVATPFALEYRADWLYGVAAITNLARAGSREHWVSDTVAGSLLGYGLGRLFWESSRAREKSGPRVMLTPSGILVASEW